MNITISQKAPDSPHDVIVAFSKSNVNADLLQNLGAKFNPFDFSGDAKEILFCYDTNTSKKIFILGLGEEKDINKTALFFRSCVYQNRKKFQPTLVLYVDHLSTGQITQAITGTLAGLKPNGVFKLEKEVLNTTQLHIVSTLSENDNTIREAILMSETLMSMMHLVDMPSNIKTPEYIGKVAQESGMKNNYKVQVYNKSELEEMGMKALLAVGQGSINHPVLIVVEYNPDKSDSKTPVLGLVGKGISFDTGGLSIKPSANMGYMKSDMAGAAAVLGCIEMAAKLKINTKIIGVIPCAENSVDAYSIRPGDIIGSYSGKSIEVIDTDAEGRLILADGLAYLLKNYKPDYIIDVATLTGSIVQSLGYHAAGMFTQSDEMVQIMNRASDIAGERVWRMPLWDDYMSEMLSDMADIKNLSGKPVAGAITAAKFLEFFTDNHSKWMHLDIAGVAFTDSEFTKQRSASGYGIRLLTEFSRLI